MFPTAFVAALGVFPLATSGLSRGRVVILNDLCGASCVGGGAGGPPAAWADRCLVVADCRQATAWAGFFRPGLTVAERAAAAAGTTGGASSDWEDSDSDESGSEKRGRGRGNKSAAARKKGNTATASQKTKTTTLTPASLTGLSEKAKADCDGTSFVFASPAAQALLRAPRHSTAR